MITIDDYWLTFVIGTALPIVVALVTKSNAAPTVKAVVLVTLSVLTAAFTQIQMNGGNFDLKPTVIGFFVAWITAVATHFGLLRPAAVTGAHGRVARAVPGGIG